MIVICIPKIRKVQQVHTTTTYIVLSLVNVSYHLINVFYNDEIDAVELRMMLYYKSYGAH